MPDYKALYEQKKLTADDVASLGFEFGFLKKKAHIEVDSFGFDFVFPEMGTL